MEPGNQWFVTGSADRTIKVRETENNQLSMLVNALIAFVGVCIKCQKQLQILSNTINSEHESSLLNFGTAV